MKENPREHCLMLRDQVAVRVTERTGPLSLLYAVNVCDYVLLIV